MLVTRTFLSNTFLAIFAFSIVHTNNYKYIRYSFFAHKKNNKKKHLKDSKLIILTCFDISAHINCNI